MVCGLWSVGVRVPTFMVRIFSSEVGFFLWDREHRAEASSTRDRQPCSDRLPPQIINDRQEWFIIRGHAKIH